MEGDACRHLTNSLDEHRGCVCWTGGSATKWVMPARLHALATAACSHVVVGRSSYTTLMCTHRFNRYSCLPSCGLLPPPPPLLLLLVPSQAHAAAKGARHAANKASGAAAAAADKVKGGTKGAANTAANLGATAGDVAGGWGVTPG